MKGVHSRIFLGSSATVLGFASLVCGHSVQAQDMPQGAEASASRPGPAVASSPQAAVGQSPDAQSASNPDALGDIIVTAQKREQRLNDVGMSISAIGATELTSRGVTRPEDLVKVVPSLTVTKTQFDVPIYTLRGVGFFDNSLAAPPTVSTYVDQVPLAYPTMARGATLDLERVEVLKGPQGTVFGQNSTGGLINYIAAKPTKNFHFGGEVSYARFDQVDANAFISGPLAEDVQARLSASTTQGGAWQRSATRAGDTLGDQRFSRARLLLDAQPLAGVRLSANVNGWVDKSDTQAPETVDPVDPLNGVAVAPILIISRNLQQLDPENPRTADWDAGTKFRRNDWFVQSSLRADIDVAEGVTLTSISAYSHLQRNSLNDGDGTPAHDLVIRLSGSIDDFSQEVRLAGNSFADRLQWTVGGSYQHDKVSDVDAFSFGTDGGGFLIPGVGSFNNGVAFADSRLRSIAGFASGDFKVTPTLTASAGVRYTSNSYHYVGCTRDAGDGALANILGTIQQFALKVPRTTAPGQCVTLRTDATTPPSQLFTTGTLDDTLKEDNVSWRAGLNWKPFGRDTLLYANVSRGYKGGSFPLAAANLTSQLNPVTQESLTAYEVGFKTSPAPRTLQLNGAAFYYDYRNKQIVGRVPSIFGQLQALRNIPKSRIWGLELQANWQPVHGLVANASGTYVNSRILRNPDGSDVTAFPDRTHADAAPVPITGQVYPFTPKLSGTLDVQYTFGLTERLDAVLGGGVTYQSRSKAGLTPADPSRPTDSGFNSTTTYNDPVFSLRPYTLVDLRAGVASADGRWRATIWGRNIFNTYYTPSITRIQDTIARYTGAPATYGVTLGFRM